jgi:hypothetical protein
MRLVLTSLIFITAFSTAPRTGVCLEARQGLGRVGEMIVYDVKAGPVPLGRAVFHEVSEAEIQKAPVYFITFETRVTKFYDLEKIYCDRTSFLPLKIERDVRQWPSRENITEEYDQKNFTLTISKKKGSRKEKTTIQKKGPIHNAILLPYYVRRIPDLDIGWTMEARLPTRDLAVTLVSIEDVRVPAGTFKAYHFESTPKQFEIWITADERRIPVKIVGSGIFGYSMLMREYRS